MLESTPENEIRLPDLSTGDILIGVGSDLRCRMGARAKGEKVRHLAPSRARSTFSSRTFTDRRHGMLGSELPLGFPTVITHGF
jgi:hypothetical protein